MLANVRPWRCKYDGATREWDIFHDDILGVPEGVTPLGADNDITFEDADVARFKAQSSPSFTHADWEKLAAVPAADIPAMGSDPTAANAPAPDPRGDMIRSRWVRPPSMNSLRVQRLGHVWARQGALAGNRLPPVPGMSQAAVAGLLLGGRKMLSDIEDVTATREGLGMMTADDDERLSAFAACLADIGRELMAKTEAASKRKGMAHRSGLV
jgi:hypothetical protein